MKRKKIKFT